MLVPFRRAVVGLWLVVSTLALLVACSEQRREAARPSIDPLGPAPVGPAERWVPVERFVRVRDGITPVPTATIGSETRPVLHPTEAFSLNYTPAYSVPADGTLVLHPPLPPELQLDQVLIESRVRPGDRWVSLPGRLVSSRLSRGKLRVDVDLALPEAAGQEAGVWVQALAPVVGERATESAPVPVPPRAHLGFAVGILEAAWGQGAVEFTVSACEADACEPVFRKSLDPSRDDGRAWREERVSLRDLAGRRVAFRFETRALGTGEDPAGHSLPVWGDPTLFATEPRDKSEKNLILLSLDTLRADHMSAYGYARETTPFIDRTLVAGGTLFERYVAAASSTRPSHMTMFTSLQPSVHGATENVGVRSLPLGATTLAELLRGARFATAGVTENGAIDRSRGFGRGFAVYVENRDSQSANMRTGHIDQTFEDGLDWLAAHRDERFFLFLHTYQVHNPFTPPAEYDDHFGGEAGIREPPSYLREDWSPLLYDREIRYTDDRVRELFAALEERGLLEDTVFVLTSDHGEAFLEHDFVAHGANVHEEVLNVPLVFYGAGVPAGRRIDTAVPMVDLMPTLLDLLGVAPAGQEMGRSQAGLIRDRDAATVPAPRPIYSEAWATRAYRARGMDTIDQPTLAVRLGSRKLIRARNGDRFRYELYDLEKDPSEQHDLYAEDPASAAGLVVLLEDYDAATAKLHEDLSSGDRGTGTIDPTLHEKLKALGYLE